MLSNTLNLRRSPCTPVDSTSTSSNSIVIPKSLIPRHRSDDQIQVELHHVHEDYELFDITDISRVVDLQGASSDSIITVRYARREGGITRNNFMSKQCYIM